MSMWIGNFKLILAGNILYRPPKKKRDLKVFNVQKKLNKSTSRDPQMLPETEEIQYSYVTNLCMFCDVLQVR